MSANCDLCQKLCFEREMDTILHNNKTKLVGHCCINKIDIVYLDRKLVDLFYKAYSMACDMTENDCDGLYVEPTSAYKECGRSILPKDISEWAWNVYMAYCNEEVVVEVV